VVGVRLYWHIEVSTRGSRVLDLVHTKCTGQEEVDEVGAKEGCNVLC
jgi:hypothetical protein